MCDDEGLSVHTSSVLALSLKLAGGTRSADSRKSKRRAFKYQQSVCLQSLDSEIRDAAYPTTSRAHKTYGHSSRDCQL